MPRIGSFKALFTVSVLVIGGVLLTACGNGVGVSPASSTTSGVSAPTSPTNPTNPTNPSNPAPPPSPTTGSANLSWSVPTQNTNGTPLTDLAGYHIYYGSSQGSWTTTITVLDASETSYVVNGLAPGTYYFAVVAFNSEGTDSPESNVGSKTI